MLWAEPRLSSCCRRERQDVISYGHLLAQHTQARCNSNNFNIHYWVDPESHKKLSYKVLGALYHFDLLNSKQVYKKFRKRNDIGSFNGPDYRNLLESKAKELSFRDFDEFYNEYMNTNNDVEAIEIKQIMSLLKNEKQI